MKNPVEELIETAIFSSDPKKMAQARLQIRKLAQQQRIYPASTFSLYQAFGQKKLAGFTVPAINIRTLTFDTAKIIFEIMQEKKIGPVIFEIARSEIGYTAQEPDEYAVCVLAAAIAADYQGPVFIQGDHYQFKAKVFQENPTKEIDEIKRLIAKSVAAGFYNIDIDASTLVDLNKTKLDDQQKNNYQMTALMTKYIRSLEPNGVTISIGGEIGHIGGKNSTVEEFEAFMGGYNKEIRNSKFEIRNNKIIGISKVSVQTGTSHGGIPLPDGTIAQVKIDFNVLKNISDIAQKKYHLGGAVQHGASTLPIALFHQFPKNNTLEIHLATEFQNIVYDNMEPKLKLEIYHWLKTNLKDEWKSGQTEDQFIYKVRKKALASFKSKIWHQPNRDKNNTLQQLKQRFVLIFQQLNIFGAKNILENYYQ